MARQSKRTRLDRRTLLAGAAACSLSAVPGLSSAADDPSACGADAPPDRSGGWRALSEHVAVSGGAGQGSRDGTQSDSQGSQGGQSDSQGGVVLDGRRALLIDCPDAALGRQLKTHGVERVERLLLTHYHRDQLCAAPQVVGDATHIGATAAERPWIEKAGDYWRDPKQRWHIYGFRNYRLVPAAPLPVHDSLADGQEFRFGGATIRVLHTPGHTDGSASYLVEADGRRIVFCGDAIYAGGRLWDLHSLQKGVGTMDYHGFLGARRELAASLRKIRDLRPDVLVPSHGPAIDEPAAAIDALVSRLETCYERYAAISALRHYFPKLFVDYAGRAGQMPIGPGRPVPDCLTHIGTTWVLRSATKAALVMDCGGANVVEEIKRLVRAGRIGRVEGLWVTHYHDDHVDAIPEFQKAFACDCFTDRHVAEVIARPLDWKLPCISPSVARVDRPLEDGHSWNWHEFKLTSYHFPGQTLHHAGLLAESGELRMFFAGDSFTAAGIDDYCAQNRNWLGAGVGFDRCVALLAKLRPTHVFNCHVNDAFGFTSEQYAAMRANLAQRERLFGELVAWDHPNYGMDDAWLHCHPYEQKGQGGAAARFSMVVTNHSTAPRKAFCRAVLPAGLGGRVGAWQSAVVPAKSAARIVLEAALPPDARPGRHVVVVDVDYHDRRLPQAAEAIVVV